MKLFATLTILTVFAVAGCWAKCDPNEPIACPAIYLPVCATFRKTFASDCSLKAELCKLANDGFEYTGELTKGDCCQRPCTKELIKTCGSDGNVYDNNCLLKKAGCENRDWIEAVEMENCQSPVGEIFDS